MISPLQLDDHHVLDLGIRTNPTWEAPEEDVPFSLILQTRGETLRVIGEEEPPYTRFSVGTHFFEEEQDENATLSARTILTLDVNGEPEDRDVTPYSLRLVLYGEFRAGGFPTEGDARADALHVVRANSAGLLYGIARQLVAELTLLTPYRSTNLPSLSFQQVIEREVELEAEAVEAASNDD